MLKDVNYTMLCQSKTGISKFPSSLDVAWIYNHILSNSTWGLEDSSRLLNLNTCSVSSGCTAYLHRLCNVFLTYSLLPIPTTPQPSFGTCPFLGSCNELSHGRGCSSFQQSIPHPATRTTWLEHKSSLVLQLRNPYGWAVACGIKSRPGSLVPMVWPQPPFLEVLLTLPFEARLQAACPTLYSACCWRICTCSILLLEILPRWCLRLCSGVTFSFRDLWLTLLCSPTTPGTGPNIGPVTLSHSKTPHVCFSPTQP